VNFPDETPEKIAARREALRAWREKHPPRVFREVKLPRMIGGRFEEPAAAAPPKPITQEDVERAIAELHESRAKNSEEN